MYNIYIYIYLYRYIFFHHIYICVCVYINNEQISFANPPAAKVPLRGSLAVDASRQICQTGIQLQLGRVPFSNRADRQKVHRTVVIRIICKSAQNRPNGQFRYNMGGQVAHAKDGQV